jgi:hypothetical protein
MTGKMWLFSFLCSSLKGIIKGNRYCISITINITFIELNDIQQEKNPFSIRKQHNAGDINGNIKRKIGIVSAFISVLLLIL